MLHDKIKSELKAAMLEKNQIKLGVVRGILAAFTNELVAKKRKPDEKLSNDEALAVIRRLAKQRQDSIAQFKAGGRADLVASEEAELAHLQDYLPALMGQAEVKKMVEAKMQALQITSKQDAGKLMSEVMKELKGRADGAVVKATVETLLK